MDMTPFSKKCDILGELWINYKEDEVFADFIAYNDLGLPMAYMASEGFAELTDAAIPYVEETYELFLQALGLEDSGWDSLNDILEAGEETE